jgi:hypothetical protein
MMAEYASFKTRNYPTTVAHRGREVELGVWVRAWALGGVPFGLLLGVLYLVAICHH